jgi:hypothetical protein
MPLTPALRMLVLVVLAAALLASPATLRAQTTRAAVSGAVRDPLGGAVAGASVTLTSHSQGHLLQATTDAEGRFVFPAVGPDAYTLRVVRTGFKALERTNLAVSANDRLFAGVLVLEVGAVEESVSVTSRVSELQATSGERSFTLEGQALANIANNGRSVFGLATLAPGVQPAGANGFLPESADGLIVNGQRPNSNNVTIDGVGNLDTGNNGANMASTNLDAVEEIKILTGSYQAEYGRAAGGQIQIVTKSGAQAFHGSGYWYGRRSGWNANSWTNKRNAAPPPLGVGQETPLPDASRNDFGYTVGGPVYLPGVFNTGRRKLFFFWSQEFQKRNDSVAERQSRVPTELERRGDFSESLDSSGNPFPYIRDYQTGLPCSPTDTRGCFQDGGVLGRIPSARLYAPGLAALGIYPLPNFAGASGINYSSQSPADQPRREDLLRLDYHPSDRWRLSARYMHKTDTQGQPYGALGASSNNLDTVDATVLFPGWNGMVSATGVLDSSTSLELTLGAAHNSIDVSAGNPLLRRSAAGLAGLPLLFPDAVQQDYIPEIHFEGGRVGRVQPGYFATSYGPFTNANTTYDAVVALTRLFGPHTGKLGVYFQRSEKRQSTFAPFNGVISFVDGTGSQYDTGFAYANAATGAFTEYTQASKYALADWRYDNLEWYAQDTWKAGRRLTLDYGVRFYWLTPQWDTTLQSSNFLPERFDPSQAATLYAPVCIGSYPCSGGNRRGMDPRLAGQTPTLANTVDQRFIGRLTPDSNRFNGSFQAGQGIGDQLQSGSALRVSPRFGFVYDVSGRGTTIVRGGGGVFYDRPQGNTVFDLVGNAPGALTSTLQFGRLQDLATASGDPYPTLSLHPTAFDFKPPKVYAWNVGVQRKLVHAITLDVAYVGSSSRDLLRLWQLNAVPLGAKFLPQNQDPTRAPSPVPGATALPNDLLRPYPGYSDILMWGYTSSGNYNALQASLQRRFDDGLLFGIFYVWSKALTLEQANDYLSGAPACQCGPPNFTPEEVHALDYSYAPYDRRHNLVVNFVYQTPRIAHGLVGAIANDWQLSGIYRWMSGRPYPILYSIPGIGAANLTGNNGQPSARVVLTGDPGSGSSRDPYRQLDSSLFAPPQPGSRADESARLFLHGPAVDNLDLSLSKSFQVGRQVRLEVRLDAFNALNHTQFVAVNNTANFASLTDRTITNLPYDATGRLVRPNGFGAVSGVAPPRTLQLVTRLTF